MKVKEVMKTEVFTISPADTVRDAAVLMSEHGIGCLVAEKKGNMQGILTEWDIVKNVVSEDMLPSKTKVEDVMTTDIITIDEDSDIHEAVDLMNEHKIKKLPVVSKDNLVGIISAIDLCEVHPKLLKEMESVFMMNKKKNGSYAG